MPKSSITKIIITIIIALLVPIFTYTVFQFVQSDKNEKLVESIYDRQLSSILFSVNQYCWDVFNSWSAELTALAESFTRHSFGSLKSGLYNFQSNLPGITGAFVRFSQQNIVYSIADETAIFDTEFKRAEFTQRINTIIENNHSELERTIKQAQKGYIRPIAILWENNPRARITLLIFPIDKKSYSTDITILTGIFIDDIAYIHEIIARKFGSMNDGNFIFAVKERDKVLFSTEEIEEGEFEKKEALWILPELDIQIKLSGTTLAQLSRSRTRTNLLFLIVVNIVFLGGLAYLLYNVSIEISLAKMKTNFVANVSHELRTPLALIRMFAETLEMGRVPSEEKKQHYYKTIMSESARLSQLINNILDFSNIESHNKEYNFKKSNISSLVMQTLDLYHFRFVQKGFTIELDMEDDLPEIDVDSEAVTQAIVNLLDNAVKYTLDEKYIKIILKRKNGNLELSIQDKGIGIQESEQKKIFEKFYRAGNSLVHNNRGSGLGLSLVKHIMDVHRGQINVKSKPNKGSIFTLVFPEFNENGAN